MFKVSAQHSPRRNKTECCQFNDILQTLILENWYRTSQTCLVDRPLRQVSISSCFTEMSGSNTSASTETQRDWVTCLDTCVFLPSSLIPDSATNIVGGTARRHHRDWPPACPTISFAYAKSLFAPHGCQCGQDTPRGRNDPWRDIVSSSL